MYEDHFGLTGRPFQLTPDPAFWFETATHRKAMAYLGYGLAQGEGFIVVTGDIGAGKTTLVGHLMEEIDPAIMTPIRLVSTQIEADDLLRIVAAGLGVEAAGRSKAELLGLIERALHSVARTGRRTLLVVDEAQALATSALEELRMLSNFQAGGHALLQILLLGQPEFRERLNGSDRLEQLRQRVIAVHHLDPMEVDEVMPYVAHRLALVGWAGRPDFADDAFPALHRASGGVPRRLNQLASRLLLHCAVAGVDLIDARVVRAVAEDSARDLRVAAPKAAAPVLPEPAIAAPAPEAEQPHPVHAEPSPEPVEMRPVVAATEPQVARSMTPNLSLASPRPIRLAAVEAESAPQIPLTADEPAPAADCDAPADLPAAPALPFAEDRIAALEVRIEEQDAALRRVLTLLVDWVEGDGRAEPAPRRDAAA